VGKTRAPFIDPQPPRLHCATMLLYLDRLYYVRRNLTAAGGGGGVLRVCAAATGALRPITKNKY